MTVKKGEGSSASGSDMSTSQSLLRLSPPAMTSSDTRPSLGDLELHPPVAQLHHARSGLDARWTRTRLTRGSACWNIHRRQSLLSRPSAGQDADIPFTRSTTLLPRPALESLAFQASA